MRAYRIADTISGTKRLYQAVSMKYVRSKRFVLL
jgi:hypothetical protein